MNFTIYLTKSVTFFLKDDYFYVKTTTPNTRSDKKKDFFIIKKMPVKKMIELHTKLGELIETKERIDAKAKEAKENAKKSA